MLQQSKQFQTKLHKLYKLDQNSFVHPFEYGVTTKAAYSFKLFRTFYLNKFPIHCIPFEYNGLSNQISRKEMAFCTWMALNDEDNSKWRHAFNHVNGQKKFGHISVDLYSPTRKIAYFFNGCYFHYHDNCILFQHIDETKTYFGLSFENFKLKDFLVKQQLLEKFPMDVREVHYMWECHWDQITQTSQFKHFKSQHISNYRPLHRLIPRACVRGGFLETYKLRWVKCENPDQTFYYSDVNSLYSTVAMENQFPIGEPTILIGDETSQLTFVEGDFMYQNEIIYCGSAHCTVLAPTNLHKPCLPYRLNDTYNYLALCLSCIKTEQLTCKHVLEKNRAFTSCWMLTDIKLALSKGYTIIEMFEVHFYKKTAPLFKEFVQLIGSEKLKNSGGIIGLPEDEQKAYCEKINRAMNLPEAFKLKPSNVVKSDAQKQFYKDILNSLYGKFSQHCSKSKTILVSSQNALEDIAREHKIIDLLCFNDCCEILYETEKQSTPNRNSSLYIGAQIASLARTVIYKHMEVIESVGGTIFSVDTDCILYTLPSHVDNPLNFSDAFGDFKNVAPPKNEIVAFYSLGNRNYSLLYKNSDGLLSSTTKCKGLSLTSSTFEQSLSPSIYSEFLEANFRAELKELTIPQLRRVASKNRHLQSRKLTHFTFKNDLFFKRITLSSDLTLPYGYKKV